MVNRLNWRLLLAVVVALAVLIVGLELALGFLVALVLSILAGALVYARIAGRRRGGPPAAANRTQRPAPPALQPGHEVIAVRDLGGPLSEHVPRGTQGVVTSASWDRTVASFTIQGVLGVRQVQVPVRPGDVRRI